MLRRPLESAFAASVAMMHEPAAMDRPPIVQCLFQRIEHEAGMRSARSTIARQSMSDRDWIGCKAARRTRRRNNA
jgi:hypothetical protein